MPAGNRKAGRPAPRTRWRARVGEERSRGARGKGTRPGTPRGSPHERREARRARPNGLSSAAPARSPPGLRLGAMNRAFSRCVVQARPPRARARGDSGRPRSRPGAPAHEPPAPPPFRPAAARSSGLARRLGWAAAGPVTATPRLRAWPAPPPLGPGAVPLTRISLMPKGLRRRLRLVPGPGPRLNPRPAKVWLRPSAAGAAPPGAACDTAPASSSSSPARPPAGPPPAAAAAACTTQPPPSRLPSAAPRPPGSPAPATVGRGAWGRVGTHRRRRPGREGWGETAAIAPPARARGGGSGNRPPPPPPRPPPGVPRRLPGSYLKTGPQAPRRPGRALRILRVLQPPSPPGRLQRPGFPPLRTQRGGVTFFGWGRKSPKAVKEGVFQLLPRYSRTRPGTRLHPVTGPPGSGP